MLSPDKYAALLDILQRHVQGRLSPVEALGLNTILAELAPKTPDEEKEKDTNDASAST